MATSRNSPLVCPTLSDARKPSADERLSRSCLEVIAGTAAQRVPLMSLCSD
jgi:hypothetical protein